MSLAGEYYLAIRDFGGDRKNKPAIPSLTKNLKAEKVLKRTVVFGFD